MSQSTERDWLTEESIREHIDAGGTLLNNEQARVLLDEIDRLRKESAERQQAGLDLCGENERLAKENELYRRDAQDNRYENEHLRKLIPPDSERGPGFVGQGNWSVFAEKVVAERDAAQERVKQHLEEKIELRDELSSLCEDIRILKEENDDLRDEVGQLGGMISAMKANIKSEHTNVHYGKEEFLGIDGYGTFSLKKIDRDYWEICLQHERIALYNKKGRRIRGWIVDGNPEGDW